jgi:hypothetical protein
MILVDWQVVATFTSPILIKVVKMRPAAMISKSNIVGATLAFFSSPLLFRLIHFMGVPYNRIAEISHGITTGHPLWKQIQSRVLAPYIIKALTFGSLEYRHAHVLFHIIAVAVAAFLCWRMGKKYGGTDQSALLALTVFVTCFTFLLAPPWTIFSWDFIDILVFLVFVDFVLARKGPQWFVGLFAIAVWNRDDAFFIPLWLILDPLVQFFCQRHYKLPSVLDWRRMLAGAICIVLGLVSLELLKRNLLIEEVGWQEYPDMADRMAGRSYIIGQLGVNLAVLKWMLTRLTHGLWFTIPLFLVIVATLGAFLARLDPRRYLALYLVELSFILALFVVGIVIESRVYLALIPFVVAAAILLSNPKRS